MNRLYQQKLFGQKGSMLVVVIVSMGVFMVMAIGAISLGILQQKLNLKKIAKTQALYIAEAGVNYYRWVLYHDHEEYCNRETCKASPDYGPYGPYAYTDSTGEITGHYELYITPPAINGSTIVTIKSVGWVDDYPEVQRSIEVQCGIPSWSTYSTLSNSDIRFGSGTQVWGRIHSNGGIRFDGVANNLITSSLLDYNDPDHSGADEFGVHTHTPQDPSPDGFNPPQNVPNNTDVFKAGRTFPVNTVSFDLLDNYIDEVAALAVPPYGLSLPKTSGSKKGYHITLRTDDKIDIKVVDTVTSDCDSEDTEGISAESAYATATNTPPNGVIFVKDKVWVDGTIDGNRVTILAFEAPYTGSKTDIIINNDIRYTNYDGTDAIGLIAQRNITVGYYSEEDLKVDAALIAKEGRIGRNYYPASNSHGCSTTHSTKDVITIYGSMATRERYGFAYTDGTGYTTRNLNYDAILTYIPPPHFPTTGEYTFISWGEK